MPGSGRRTDHIHKGVNLPDTTLDIDMPTPRDREMAAWAIEHELDWLAMSFVRSEDIGSLEAWLCECGGQQRRPIPIIAKMEVPAAIACASAIAQADVMVARGDLGVELDLAEVPAVEKHLVDLS